MYVYMEDIIGGDLFVAVERPVEGPDETYVGSVELNIDGEIHTFATEADWKHFVGLVQDFNSEPEGLDDDAEY